MIVDTLSKNYPWRLIVVGCMAVAVGGCTARITKPLSQNKPISGSSTVCSQEYVPVCGKNGITYPNECMARENGAVILALGACPQPTALKDYERKFLIWLQLKRQDAKLPQVSIKRYVTAVYRCPSCYDLYYQWNSGKVTAKITVTDDKVSSAVDTTGYDYVKQRQGSPVTFPELAKIKGEGELCGGIAGFMCAGDLTCAYDPKQVNVADRSGTCVR